MEKTMSITIYYISSSLINNPNKEKRCNLWMKAIK